MSIAADSRYAFGETDPVYLPDGSTNLATFAGPLNTTDDIQVTEYISKIGDRFDSIAQSLYGDATKWWVIADMNPTPVWPGVIPVGTKLLVPLYTGVDSSSVLPQFSGAMPNMQSLGTTRG